MAPKVLKLALCPIIIIIIIIIFRPSVSMIPREEKIKLLKNENSNGYYYFLIPSVVKIPRVKS